MTAFFCLLIGLASATIPFVSSVIMREHHHKQLQGRFHGWWKRVQHQRPLDFALAVAILADRYFTHIFGKRLLRSWRVWLRSLLLSSGLLLAVLSVIGLWSKEAYWTTPWKTYNQCVNMVVNTVDSLYKIKPNGYYRQVDVVPAPAELNTSNSFVLHIHSNYYVMQLTSNSFRNIVQIAPIYHGGLGFYYNRNSVMGTNTNQLEMDAIVRNTNWTVTDTNIEASWKELQKEAQEFKTYAVNHSSPRHITIYSVSYFVVMFLVNWVLFVTSLSLARRTLVEIIEIKRTAATLSLILTNLTVVFVFSSVILLLFTLFAIPILWFAMVFFFRLSSESIYVTLFFSAVSIIGLWLSAGMWGKVIALIAFVPSGFGLVLSIFSLFAIYFRRAFHWLASAVLIRCYEKSPVTIIGLTITFIIAAIAAFAHYLHLSGFL